MNTMTTIQIALKAHATMIFILAALVEILSYIGLSSKVFYDLIVAILYYIGLSPRIFYNLIVEILSYIGLSLRFFYNLINDRKGKQERKRIKAIKAIRALNLITQKKKIDLIRRFNGLTHMGGLNRYKIEEKINKDHDRDLDNINKYYIGYY